MAPKSSPRYGKPSPNGMLPGDTPSARRNPGQEAVFCPPVLGGVRRIFCRMSKICVLPSPRGRKCAILSMKKQADAPTGAKL